MAELSNLITYTIVLKQLFPKYLNVWIQSVFGQIYQLKIGRSLDINLKYSQHTLDTAL